MRHITVLAFLVILGACSASNDTSEQGTLSDDTSSTVPAGDWRREQTSWALQAVDDRQLTIVVAMLGDPECERFDGTEVTENADRVEVRAFVRVRIPAEREELICEASAVLQDAAIELDQPLASRELNGCQTTRPIDDLLVRTQCTDIEEQL